MGNAMSTGDSAISNALNGLESVATAAVAADVAAASVGAAGVGGGGEEKEEAAAPKAQGPQPVNRVRTATSHASQRLLFTCPPCPCFSSPVFPSS